jgi:UDP-N-acetylglucosamine transferase subunit ALG13
MTDGLRIIVIVGTDHHPFERMVGWVDDRLRAHPGDTVTIQHGWSRSPELAEGLDFMAPDELRRRMAEADVVITHGGPGTISDARRSGHRPIVVPRDPTLGEHVDDHQQRFAAWCAERGVVDLAMTIDALEARLATGADTRTPAETAAETDAAVAAFAALVALPQVSRHTPAVGAPRVRWVADGAAGDAVVARLVAGGAVLADLGDPLPGDLVKDAHRRHLRREQRTRLLAAVAPLREALVALGAERPGGLVVLRGGPDRMLALSHDRAVDLSAADLGLSGTQRRAVVRRRVPLVAPSAD